MSKYSHANLELQAPESAAVLCSPVTLSYIILAAIGTKAYHLREKRDLPTGGIASLQPYVGRRSLHVYLYH